MRIVIVEDESLVAMGLQGMLEENGHEVVAMATRGATAAELILQYKPDVALLDINLKGDGLDGLDVCRLAIEMTKTKVIIITAYSDPETQRRAREAGADEIMIKPITEDALMSVLDSIRDTSQKD